MLQRVFAMGLLAALVVGLPLLAADKKDPKKEDGKTIAVDSDKLAPGEFTGKLLTPPSADGGFTLQVEYKHLELKNPKQPVKNANPQMQRLVQAQRKIANLQREIANSRNPREYTQNMRELQQEMARFQQLLAQQQVKPQDNNFKEVTDYKEIDMQLADNADVRILKLPIQFDDMGQVRKYSDKELKELKGKKPTLPGYEGKTADLKANQIVKVTLARVAPKPAVPGEKPEMEKKMQVTVVVVVEEAPEPDPKGKKKKK